jgi:hypothetical protein
MLKTMSWAVAGWAAGLTLLAAAPSASAQANCEMYAKLAVQQQKQNEESKCDLKGPDWSADAKGHMSWCASASPQQWQAALQRRKQALDTCGK